MNFNIIENSQPKYIEEFDKFVKLYKNPNIRKKDILKKLDLSDKQYYKARQKAIKENLIKDEYRKKPKNYHYSKTRNQWIVQKQSKKQKIYTTCHSEKEAKELVKYLNTNGWSRKNIWIFKDKWKKWDSKSK